MFVLALRRDTARSKCAALHHKSIKVGLRTIGSPFWTNDKLQFGCPIFCKVKKSALQSWSRLRNLHYKKKICFVNESIISSLFKKNLNQNIIQAFFLK